VSACERRSAFSTPIETFRCGPGKDVAVAEPGDRLASDCETLRGLPSIAIADAAVAEGDDGPTTLSFPVLLSKPVTQSVVRYTAKDGTGDRTG
jgi:hypothetical protein